MFPPIGRQQGRYGCALAEAGVHDDAATVALDDFFGDVEVQTVSEAGPCAVERLE